MPELPVMPHERVDAPAPAEGCGRPNCCGGHGHGRERAKNTASAATAARRAAARPRSAGARFLREFLANPIATAAVAPSSRHLAAAMLRGVDMASLRTIVEFGPGTGVFTRAVLEGLRAAGNREALFIAIEKNARMAAELREEMAALGLPAGEGASGSPAGAPSNGPGVLVLDGDALDVARILREHGREHADFILSGLGWPSIPARIRDAILESTAAVLPGGREFRTFGYHIGLTLPGAWGFRRTVRRLFSRVTISPVVWRNLPPAFVYACVK